jgi:hypothetical protein
MTMAFSLALFACKKAPMSQLPPETQSGANTFVDRKLSCCSANSLRF